MADEHTSGGREAGAAALGRLREVRHALLRLHKILLDDERGRYERRHGQVTGGELLQLVLNDAQFEWLRAISELIVRIDETFEADEPPTHADADELLAQTTRLLTPSESAAGFPGKYFAALQREPAAVLAHREVKSLLKD